MTCSHGRKSPVVANWITNGVDDFPRCSACNSISTEAFTALVRAGARLISNNEHSETVRVQFQTGLPRTRTLVNGKVVMVGGITECKYCYSHSSDKP